MGNKSSDQIINQEHDQQVVAVSGFESDLLKSKNLSQKGNNYSQNAKKENSFLPAVRMVRHKESMITSNVDLNSSKSGTPDSEKLDDKDRNLSSAPVISVVDLQDESNNNNEMKKKHFTPDKMYSNNRNNIPLIHISPKKAEINYNKSKSSMQGTGQLEDVLEEIHEEETP